MDAIVTHSWLDRIVDNIFSDFRSKEYLTKNIGKFEEKRSDFSIYYQF
jgi:hypothetical protein